jgi:hypothetical protein
MADDLPLRFCDQVAPIVGATEGRDLLHESLVRELSWLRYEKTRLRRNRSFGLRQHGRVLDARWPDRDIPLQQVQRFTTCLPNGDN